MQKEEKKLFHEELEIPTLAIPVIFPYLLFFGYLFTEKMELSHVSMIGVVFLIFLTSIVVGSLMMTATVMLVDFLLELKIKNNLYKAKEFRNYVCENPNGHYLWMIGLHLLGLLVYSCTIGTLVHTVMEKDLLPALCGWSMHFACMLWLSDGLNELVLNISYKRFIKHNMYANYETTDKEPVCRERVAYKETEVMEKSLACASDKVHQEIQQLKAMISTINTEELDVEQQHLVEKIQQTILPRLQEEYDELNADQKEAEESNIINSINSLHQLVNDMQNQLENQKVQKIKKTVQLIEEMKKEIN